MKLKIYLKLINRNKALQSRLNISNKTYHDYCRIIFELIPIKPIQNDNKNYFINFRGDMSFLHIYINDNEEEYDKTYLTKNDNINKIRVEIDFEVKYIFELFKDCTCLKEIKLVKYIRKDITDLSNLFKGCSMLTNLDINNLNTNNVTNISSIFSGCSSLRKINITNFNTKNVTKMSFMFNSCIKLEEISGLNNFNTEKVTNMEYMFWGCKNLKRIDLSTFNTKNVRDMSFMFYGCILITELNITGFNTNQVYDMSGMFSDCERLYNLDGSKLINNNTNVKWMFSRCPKSIKYKMKIQIKNLSEDAFYD